MAPEIGPKSFGSFEKRTPGSGSQVQNFASALVLQVICQEYGFQNKFMYAFGKPYSAYFLIPERK